MDQKSSKRAISELDVEKAFKLLEFYENAASTVKGRTWTITVWVLTINSALFAFCFQLYKEKSDLFGFLYIQFVICTVGAARCIFLYFLIQDQGNHLKHYWTKQNKIGA